MKNMLHDILQFIYSKRKQILFALFAIICSIIDKDIGVLKCAAPAVVAAAAAGSGSAAGAAGTAGAVGAASTSATAGATTTAGAVGSTNGISSVANNAAKDAVKTGVKKSVPAENKNINPNSNVPKNTNPKGTHSNTLSSPSVSSEFSKPSASMNEGTDKAVKKEAAKSDISKDKSLSKRNMMSPLSDNDYEDEEEVSLDSASKEIIKDSTALKVGCILLLIFGPILFIPLLILTIINPTSSVMSQIDCSIYDGVNCVQSDDSGSFVNKLKNLFTFGSFANNSEVVIEKITEVQEKIKDEEDFTINLPLLSSTLFSDSEYSKTELNENNEPTITDKMLERLEYVEDLARMQMIEDFVVYTCSTKVVDGVNIYYKETNYDSIDISMVSEGECNSSTVGMVLKEKSIQYNEDEYFSRLKESELLDLVYSDFVESDDLLVSKIRNQYKLFNSLNLIKTEDDDYGNVPLSLMYDSNVNISAPLKGWYYITSPFGMRDGVFAGMHTGIDLIANDKNIYAAGTGIVTRSNVETEGGNVVEITHTASDGTEYVTQYAHLSQRLVSVGDVITSGDIIGIMGETGTMASGVHLHFAMWRKEPFERLNPKNLFTGASNY